MKVFYSSSYVAARHSSDTTRKAAWMAESLRTSPIAGIEIEAPDPLTAEKLEKVHAPSYVRAVRRGQPEELAGSSGLDWDPKVWPMALATNGGVVAAALAALHDGVAGSLSSGLHHARYDRGEGLCTFNGLMLAARAALIAGARAVLILDFDAHCGGGTHSLIGNDPAIQQADVAVDSFDAYRGSAKQTLDFVRRADAYLPTIEARLARLEEAWPAFDLCLYNAGMDPFEGCALGGLRGITKSLLERREQLVFDWCGRQHIAVAFVLAGGYTGERLDRDRLVALHRLTLAGALRLQPGGPPARPPKSSLTWISPQLDRRIERVTNSPTIRAAGPRRWQELVTSATEAKEWEYLPACYQDLVVRAEQDV